MVRRDIANYARRLLGHCRHPSLGHGQARDGQRIRLFGIAAPRTSQRVRPQGDGGINETKFRDGKLIVLNGEIMSNVGIEDCYSEFHSICAPMEDTLDYGEALLKWT